ncbi:anti-adapter protein IraM [Salmonella enterica subsp. enterica serovar Brandenburg]|uniref:anti-adapter protein IraM n=1 Tax=Salmonella enterica TaxID=28901 RepID=UPI0012C67FDE|nr:anti-adapter protein IraM [Salmonella enterica subsp. enterica serovar Schwarzengrund]EMC1192365.1 anti-adapter protein IraM [Salmonella enterica]
MEWMIVDTAVSPEEGVCFSWIFGFKNLQLTIWYQTDLFLIPGSLIEPCNEGILINKKIFPITIYNATPFNKQLWNELKTKTACPGNTGIRNTLCTSSCRCRLGVCPFGLEKTKN